MAASIARGVVAGIGGTGVMTAFQTVMEMPLTGRGESFAPANFAAKVLPISPRNRHERRQLNWVTHFGLGAMWGTAFGIAGRAGLRGQKAVAAVFAAVYTGDVLLNTALGLYEPTKWSGRDVVIDVVDKLVQAEATGLMFDRMRDV
ncbi:MAG: hypothetical protein KY454_07395 [Actinobacteria bacterium]|nr:hypothetical protein [Actinomycetota bacterium]MBW3650924.1 hypothetical protein [Actinomycetota bacterium]